MPAPPPEGGGAEELLRLRVSPASDPVVWSSTTTVDQQALERALPLEGSTTRPCTAAEMAAWSWH